MNKRLFKKMITAVLTAALLFTSNGVASLNASAAEKINVEGVYANFLKATMSTGTSRQINAYVQPEDATVQKMSYKSSAPEIAKVSATGLITALSPGKATITVTALDGSGEYETIAITVLEDLYITDEDVDSDNDVIVMDKTYGNLTIDTSVGDADVYLAGVKVRNKLAMASGDYSVIAYDSTINKVVIDDGQGEIVSFVADTDNEEDKKVPSLIVGENTDVNEIIVRINASIRQEDGSEIEGLRFTQDKEGKITIYLENYSGGLLLDASLGDIEVISTACNLENVTISGGEEAGNVILSNGGDSTIKNLLLTGAAKLDLGLPTTEVTIDSKARGASFTASEEVGTLKNEGSDSVVKVTDKGFVNNLEANGEGAKIEVASGGYLGLIHINGAGTSLSGAGDISEAFVNANNVSIDTVNTLVTVGSVEGTKIQGKDVAGDSTVITEPPSFGAGGGGPAASEPETPIEIGEIIIDNDFEDGKYDLRSVQGEVSISVVDSNEPERGKVSYISNKNAEWAGAGVDLARYLGNYITIDISAKIKAEQDGNVKVTIKYNTDKFDQPDGCDVYASANTWTELNGSYLLDSTITSAVIYFEASGNYYLDDVLITVANIGEPIPAETVTINQTELSLNKNESKRLTVTVAPSNADVRTVTWSSSNIEVATVDADGVVRGIEAGKAIITATSNCPYAEEAPLATIEVEVMDIVVIDLNKNYIFFTAEGETETLIASEPATWKSSDEAVATVSDVGLVTAVGNGRATIQGIIPGGIGICTVNVELQPEGAFIFDFDDETVGTALNFQGGGKATIAKDPTILGSTNQVLKVEPSGYSQFTYVEITLPDGKKLGDYTSLLGKIYLSQGDVNNKDLVVLAGKTVSDLSLSHDLTPSQIGKSANKPMNEVFEPIVAEFNTMSATLSNLTGTITLGFGVHCAGTGGAESLPTIYYLDELVLVPYTGDPVAIEGITLNEDTLTLVEGKTEQLIATIEPDGYTTNGVITWTSSDETVATVDTNGKVTAKKAGTAVITAKTAIDGVSEVSYEATCTVTVTEAPVAPTDLIKVDFEGDEVGTSYKMIGNWLDDASAKVVQLFETNKALEIKPADYNTAAVISITLPTGKTLSDYSTITYRAYWKSGDVGWKDVWAIAGQPLSGTFNSDSRKIGGYSRDAGTTSDFKSEEFELDLSDALGALSGTIEIALGINCRGSKTDEAYGGPADTVYYLDDITLVPKKDVKAIVLTDSSSPTYGLNIEASAVSGSALTYEGVENVVAVSGGALVASGQEWAVASIDLSEYLGKTVTITAKIRRSTEGNYAWQVNSDYSSIDPKWGASADTWYNVSGSLEILEPCLLYLSPGPTVEDTMYYISDVVIKVE